MRLLGLGELGERSLVRVAANQGGSPMAELGPLGELFLWDQAVWASKAAMRMRLYTAPVIRNHARLRCSPM